MAQLLASAFGHLIYALGRRADLYVLDRSLIPGIMVAAADEKSYVDKYYLE